MGETEDKDTFCWFNPSQTLDILLLIIMYQFMGMMNKKINIFKYPSLFRLCQNSEEKKTAQKCSCKEWLNRWIVFIKKPKIIKKHRNQLSTIDLGGYNSPVNATNISWESIKKEKEINKNEYIWDTERDYSDDIKC